MPATDRHSRIITDATDLALIDAIKNQIMNSYRNGHPNADNILEFDRAYAADDMDALRALAKEMRIKAPTSDAPLHDPEPRSTTKKSVKDDKAFQRLVDEVKKHGKDIKDLKAGAKSTKSNLKGLNKAVGIKTNKKGAWVPILDGQLDRNIKVQQHLSYRWDKKTGKVTFGTTQAGRKPSWIPALIVLVVGIVLFVGILSFGGGMTWAAGAVSLAAALALAVYIFTNRHNR